MLESTRSKTSSMDEVQVKSVLNQCKEEEEEEELMQLQTISKINQDYFDLVIKIYPNGQIPNYLEKFSIGQTIHVSGPSGNLIYRQNDLFDIRSRKSKSFVTRHIRRRFGIIAGGSGITLMYQILNEMLKEQTSIVSNGHVGIKIWLLFANQTERDILLRDEIEQLAASNVDRLKF
ncbi:hypothetical protein I4U23_021441 [Adineta vaga]|nr:hypothetical protein I4U23_021441 [Adineta vaga]